MELLTETFYSWGSRKIYVKVSEDDLYRYLIPRVCFPPEQYIEYNGVNYITNRNIGLQYF